MTVEQLRDLTNRFNYHPPKGADDKTRHEKTRNVLMEVTVFLCEVVPEGRERAMALTKIEEAMFWANAGIARARGAGGAGGPTDQRPADQRSET
jgi:hypothetical protein